MKKRTENNTTRAAKIVRLINQEGLTWEEISEKLGLSVGYCQKLAREHYTRDKNYNNLLAKARANKKAKEETDKVIEGAETTEKSTTEEKVVILVETGYLLSEVVTKGKLEVLEKYPGRVVIPFFCIGELKKLSRSYEEAKTVLKAYWDDQILSINLKGRENVYVDPDWQAKDRTIGVVAAACELDSMGYPVRILTNSKEIEKLADLQECGFTVMRQ